MMKNKSLHTILSIFLYLILYSCDTKINNNINQQISHKLIQINDVISHDARLIAFDNVIVAAEGSNSLPPFYYVSIDGNKGKLCRCGTRGNGPEDIVYPFLAQYIDNGTIGVYDYGSASYCKIHITKEDTVFSCSFEKRLKFEPLPYRVLETAYNQYIVLTSDSLLMLTDTLGNKISSFFEYPYKDENEHSISHRIRASVYQGWFISNPSKTKCVYASVIGRIIRFFNISENNVTLIKSVETDFPKYKVEGEYHTPKDRSSRWGYAALYATEKYVYALYNGRKLRDILDDKKRMIRSESTVLQIYDWNGDLLNTFTLDIPCTSICVTQDDETLYAIALPENDDPQLVSFNLNQETKN